VSATDQRTVGKLLADSDASARETFLDATFNNAPLRVRSWNQRAESAAGLWAVLPSEPDSPPWPNPMERPRVVGEAIGRCVTTGHWLALVTDRRTPKPDRRQPLSRAASGRARRSPCRAGNLGSGGQYPTPRPGVHTCRSFGEPQPSQSSEGRASRVSLANPQARGGRVLDTQLGGHRDSVWEAEVLITEERKSIMGEESSTPVWALRQRGSGDGVAQLESHADPRAGPEPAALQARWSFALREPARPPKATADVGSLELLSTGLEQQPRPGAAGWTTDATTNRKEDDDHAPLNCQV
jgi:hypothetical protein